MTEGLIENYHSTCYDCMNEGESSKWAYREKHKYKVETLWGNMDGYIPVKVTHIWIHSALSCSKVH